MGFARQHIYVTADRSRAVGQNDPEAAYLLAPRGSPVPDDVAERYGIEDTAASLEELYPADDPMFRGATTTILRPGSQATDTGTSQPLIMGAVANPANLNPLDATAAAVDAARAADLSGATTEGSTVEGVAAEEVKSTSKAAQAKAVQAPPENK